MTKWSTRIASIVSAGARRVSMLETIDIVGRRAAERAGDFSARHMLDSAHAAVCSKCFCAKYRKGGEGYIIAEKKSEMI